MPEESDELEQIRQRKIQALLEEQRQLEAAKETQDEEEKRRQQLVQAIFMPDAIDYLASLRKSKPQLTTRIEDIGITLFLRRQLINRIPKIGVQLIQRRLEGVESRIMVKRRGEESVSFYEAVRKDLAEYD